MPGPVGAGQGVGAGHERVGRVPGKSERSDEGERLGPADRADETDVDVDVDADVDADCARASGG
ncbi:hypothetical protein Tdes44962_MAKER09871 [Teratosphaeria destructans]|uniref:Uncharacterized protein n=1 Tax=Teratosphaeria destructans TaxID=418781 RepID=A0A9W7SQZ9_9PEZI|nr:hypothetical protein Tdes44962_MAKER09871 [Teratosphaeria destructans]